MLKKLYINLIRQLLREGEEGSSVLPLLIMASFHLGLEETSEFSLYGPSDTITFLIATLIR